MTTDAEIYRSMRETVVGLARDHRDEMERVAPATPDWRARDLLAHLGGVCDDVVNQRFEGLGSDAWTAAQVDPRRGWPVEEILVDWERNGETLDALIDQTPPGTFGQLLFDTWTHEQDLRGVFGAAGGRESDATARSYEWAMQRLGERETSTKQPALTLATEAGTHTVGVGDPVAEVRLPCFELLRAMTGRRSMAQMRAYEWRGDANPERLVLADFFTPPAADLHE
ncbi:MAG TPA: maleylpyruvate isomerase family mycothiol-dependent enzyme [Acidimicrobiia bacterium]|nr:maleylpyruvate isomerase family mycothiol-dependent enzyme [Acidimicrobiia bacterium]